MAAPLDPARFYGEHIPRQFNAAFDAEQERGEAGRRVHAAMRAVNATIQVVVEGPDGGTFFLNIRDGQMAAGAGADRPPFLTLLQDRHGFERLAEETGDSALALLGGLSGITGELKFTRDRIERLREIDGLVRFEVTGEGGFALRTHFGETPVPNAPKTTISVEDVDYRALRSGDLDAQEAFMTQRIRVDGDMQAALQLAMAALEDA